jgi:hypothetical protein
MSLGPEEALRQLRQISDRQRRGIVDLEDDHMEADNILQTLLFDMGYTEIADEYDEIGRSFSDLVERSSPIYARRGTP